jgi:quinol monooxygenase YgiN
VNEDPVSKPCIIVAIFRPLPEFYDDVLAVLKDVTPDVHKESGCELYAIHEEVDGKIVFIEKWTTRAQWQVHLTLDTVARIKAGVSGKVIQDVEVLEMYGLPVGEATKDAL